MTEIKPKYVVDENDRRVAALIDIATFEKIEETLENYALFSMIKEVENDEGLSLPEARIYYDELLQRHAD